MKTLVLIHAHGGTEEILDRHMPFWTAHPNSDVVISCPEDLPILDRTDCRVMKIGTQGYSGAIAIERFVKTWQWALTEMDALGCERIVIFEYDSICLTPSFPYDPRFMMANAFVEFKHSDPTYKSPLLALAPWIMSRDIFGNVVREISTGDFTNEGGCFDRYLMLRLVNAPEIKFFNFGHYGFQTHGGVTEMPRLVDAVVKGAVCLHCVKTKEMLDAAVYARLKTGESERFEWT